MSWDSFNLLRSHEALMPSFTPALIMFGLTVLFVTLFFLPATYERKSPLLNFYWVGFWLFPGLIFSLSGAQQTVAMLGLDSAPISERLITAATLTFVLFVVFGWFRLSGAALFKMAAPIRQTGSKL